MPWYRRSLVNARWIAAGVAAFVVLVGAVVLAIPRRPPDSGGIRELGTTDSAIQAPSAQGVQPWVSAEQAPPSVAPVSPSPGPVQQGGTASACVSDERPRSGTLLRKPLGVGGNSIRVENGADHDAVIQLVDTRQHWTARTAYVRASEQAELRRLAPGEYLLRWVYGDGYISRGGFCQLLGAMGADTLQPITESRTLDDDGGIHVHRRDLSVTLYTVPGGNLGLAPIDPSVVLDSLRAQ